MRVLILVLMALPGGPATPNAEPPRTAVLGSATCAVAPTASPHARGTPVRIARTDSLRARRGDRLVLQNVTGRVHVQAVDGDMLRVTPSSASGEGTVRLSRSGDRIELTDRDRKGRL